jgi:hypothetical protein
VPVKLFLLFTSEVICLSEVPIEVLQLADSYLLQDATEKLSKNYEDNDGVNRCQ